MLCLSSVSLLVSFSVYSPPNHIETSRASTIPIFSYFLTKFLFCREIPFSYFLAILPVILVFYSLYHYFMRKLSLKFFRLALLCIKILFAHFILQIRRYFQYPTTVITTKALLGDRRGRVIVLNVKEIVKIPQEVTGIMWFLAPLVHDEVILFCV